ncbi:mechanosensitive ion channel family protein [Aurantiacibacter poecillastricola]|uniref:mechanosensitive ion channel family protein n=1 Tax=Aurantiacibacter poecillastricola TaxID=3064385 RepID=UPI00273F4163|nr:mechanosensitive ion channel family protein [Aurantiacibacter sp. 219JJ12-13]MDP5261273.1 mechanosensitive ion channel family protein [Aurantiacibacter sp. 219JJ12-13]
MRCFAAILLLLGILLSSPYEVRAQLPVPEQEETAAAAMDPFGRETPRSAVTALIGALAEQNYDLAGNYFAVEGEDPLGGARLARAFQASLDTGGELVPFAELSNDADGTLQDGLAPDLERVGTLAGPNEVPILLSRTQQVAESGEGVASGSGQATWRVSEQTIAALEERADQLAQAGAVDGLVFAGAPLGDWALLLVLLAVAFLFYWLLCAAILWAVRRIVADPDVSGIYRFLHAALPPFALLLAAITFRIWGSEAPVAIVARQFMLRYIGIVAWLALAWFAIRLVDAVAGKLTSRLNARERRQASSAVVLARRAVKLLIAAIAGVAILDTLGIDITTGLAALGIGGLALALGAQKTIENLVGSVMVVADRPIQVGDFCRVGDVLGTVEDIGMRSTRIRTLDRTIVTIPNGDFSSRQIENYSKRDRFLFNPVIGLEYGISAAQLRQGVAIIEKVLTDHPLIAEDPRRAKLAAFGASSLDIEVFAYIEVPEYDESLAIRQNLLMQIFEGLEKAGLAIAYPTQTLHIRRDAETASE